MLRLFKRIRDLESIVKDLYKHIDNVERELNEVKNPFKYQIGDTVKGLLILDRKHKHNYRRYITGAEVYSDCEILYTVYCNEHKKRFNITQDAIDAEFINKKLYI